MSAVAARTAVATGTDTVELCPGDELIAGYKVIERLRRGRELDAYDVWSELRHCRCVAKTLRPDRLHDRRARRRLIGEGRLLAPLAHPHIVRVYEVVELPRPVVVFETLTGATLEYLIAESRTRLPAKDIAVLGLQLCSAMHYLHHHGLLHLDLKPSNIVCERGVAKVLDFNIAQPPGKGRRGVGTRQYMAPEQARGDELTEATDVWGIGAVLFEAATGREPFAVGFGAGFAANGDRYEQLERRADPVRRHRRLPAALAQAIDRCLEPDPPRRPTVAELDAVFAALA